MDFSKFKKTDQANPTSDNQEPDSSSYATETPLVTDTYSSSDLTKGADASDEYYQKPGSYGDDTTTKDYSDKPSDGVGTYASDEYDQSGGRYGEDTEESYSKKPSYAGGATTGADEYEQPEGGYGEDKEEGFSKPGSYGGAATETDGYQKPEGEYEEDTEEGFSKKPSYDGSTAEEYGEEAADDLSGKPSGKETENYGKYTSTEDFSYTPSGAGSGDQGYDDSESNRKKPSGGYGATTGDYASDDKYNE